MTLAVTIVISAFVSLTLVPMMCARLIRHRPDSERGRFDLAAERVFNRIIAAYARALDVVLRHQPLTLFVAIATLALTALLYVAIPKGFFPSQDTGHHPGHFRRAAGCLVQGNGRACRASWREVLLKDKDVASITSFVGVDGSNLTLNSGRFLINLKPQGQRADGIAEIIRRLGGEAAACRGRQALHAAGAGPDDRRQRHPRAI